MSEGFNVNQIRNHVPKGYKLPERFNDINQEELPFCIEWNDLDSFSLKPSATKEVVPFVRFSDGSILVLWYHSAKPSVVHFDHDGDMKVVATSFDEFLNCIVTKKTGIPDIDENEEDFLIPGTQGYPNQDSIAGLQMEFDKWHQQHTSLLKPLTSPETELLRQRVCKIAEEMIRDGLSKVYTLSSSWSMSFQVERIGKGVTITYLDYGKWYEVDSKYKLAEVVAELLKIVLNKERENYEIEVGHHGIVSIDRDRELLLVPPDVDRE